MKILAAFDSFKESMTAYQAGEAVKTACGRTWHAFNASGGIPDSNWSY